MSKTSRNIPEISNVSTKNDTITFKISNINVSFVNALRRTILSDIPTAVFETTPYENNKCTIRENTSRLNNEILKQRLSCIPIHIKDLDTLENLEVELEKENTSESIMNITTNDFKIKDTTTDKYLSDTEVKKIFPIDKKTGEHILFARLRSKIAKTLPGEKITLTCKITSSTASQNGAFNVVSTCAYSFEDDVKKQNIEWEKHSKKIGEEEKVDMQLKKKNWFNHEAKRFYKDDAFNFIIETIGVYSNIELIKKACSIIINKLNTLKELYNSNKGLIEESKSSIIKNCYDVTLPNEDYTIGKIIEYIIHMDFYKNGSELSYIGFTKKHPHDTESYLRFAFNQEENYNIDSALTVLNHGITQSITIITHMNESFG
jgi:DNA-directed RNA polymerase alpha subunit